MIVWIAGWPHCGSTLLRTFLRDTFGIASYSKYPEPKLQFAFGKESDAWAEWYHKEPDAALAELDGRDEWYGIKTHDWPTDDRPAIYIARDGRDAIGSLAAFWDVPLLPLLKDLVIQRDHWIAGIRKGMRQEFGSWSTHYRVWDPRIRERTKLVWFSDILDYPEDVRLGLSQFLKKEPTGTWVDRFDEYKEQWPRMYDDKDSEHRGAMGAEMLDLFWRLHGPVMVELGFADRYNITSHESPGAGPETMYGEGE